MSGGKLRDPALRSGRVRQKQRTRARMLEAASEMFQKGRTPTITEVAEAAEVSRRTAYRYFPTQEKMLLDVSLERLRPAIDEALSGLRTNATPEEFVDAGIQIVQHSAIRNEALLRAMVATSAPGIRGKPGRKKPIRGARRIDWIEQMLGPVRDQLDSASYQRLLSGLCLCVGIEAWMVLHDVCGLSESQALDICRWTARVLIRASVDESK